MPTTYINGYTITSSICNRYEHKEVQALSPAITNNAERMKSKTQEHANDEAQPQSIALAK